MPKASIGKVRDAIEASWGLKSSSLWTEENPAAGQCGVTALVAQDHLGGEILKTPYRDLTHFYNRIGGEVIDFTQSQFSTPIKYANETASRAEAFGDTNDSQYGYLSVAVTQNLSSKD